MKIIACCKVVPDDELIVVTPSRELSFENTPYKISQYDLNALTAARSLANEAEGTTVTVLSVGTKAALEASKIRKDILSRGADDLSIYMSDDYSCDDSLAAAKVLKKAIEAGGGADLILCGTGTADIYAQETGVQLGILMGLPVVNNAINIKMVDDKTLEVERALEDCVDVLSVPLPAVISVSSEINDPPVPSMKEIMKAGKKPVNELDISIDDIKNSSVTISELAPEQAERKQNILEGDTDDNIDALVAFLKKEAF